MTPADLSALIEELEKMKNQLREQVCNHDCDVQPCPTLKQAADLLSRFRDALRGGVPTPELTKEMLLAGWRIQGDDFSHSEPPPAWEGAIKKLWKAMLAAAPQAGAKEGK